MAQIIFAPNLPFINFFDRFFTAHSCDEVDDDASLSEC